MIKQFKHIVFPWYTTLFSVALIVYYSVLIIVSNSGVISVAEMQEMGAPSAISIYSGHIYGLFTNSFIHENGWHLAVNLVGLCTLGFYLERFKGWKFLSILGLFAAIVGSAVQLNFSDDAGIGISAPLFALLTYASLHAIFIRKENLRLTIFISSTIFIGLLVFYLTNIWFDDKFAIGAKIGGILCGIFFFYGAKMPIKWRPIIPLVALIIVSFTLIYAPWSSMWQTHKGINAHQIENIDLAETHYQKALSIDPTNNVALENNRRIKIYRLSVLAFDAHREGRFTEARRYYLRILAMGKNNRWVLENLKELP